VSTALVTGGSGFIAGHVVALLLQEGYKVRTTVRSLANSSKNQHLLDLSTKYPRRLRLYEADLLRPRSFDVPMKECDLVFHIASPFLMPEQISDGIKQIVEPALLGTRNVLAAVNRTRSVRRVVLTSTVAAIFGDYSDVSRMSEGVLSDKYFNTSSTPSNNPYHYSKVAAEKEAWELVNQQQRWSLVTINPGLVMGPAITSTSDSGSLFLLNQLLRGYFFYGVPNFSFTYVDVRDVSLAHLRAAERDRANGRYILAEKQMISFLEMSQILRSVHRRPYLLPTWGIPDWVVRRIGPRFGLSKEYIRGNLGIRFPVDNQRSIDDLGIVYRPIAETLRDHYNAWNSPR